jgi:pimeloyl-ACP methyl ester carboxylesterase
MASHVEEARVTANEVEFTYLAAGEGPLALCLHGFPDSAHTWRHLLPELAAAGYRAVAPFMRGYAPTAVPAQGGYHPLALAGDANALHEALGGGPDAVIVGHDWGASATYAAAATEPDRWSKVVGLAVPPGSAFLVALTSNLAQIKRSWYMFFFQHPLADFVVPANDLAFVDQLWADWSPGFDPGDDLERAKAALVEPANLQAALGYYRDTLSPQALAELQGTPVAEPAQPLLYLHGEDDGAVGAEVASMVVGGDGTNVRVDIIPGCGHFLHLERPDVVNRLILEHLTAS